MDLINLEMILCLIVLILSSIYFIISKKYDKKYFDDKKTDYDYLEYKDK